MIPLIPLITLEEHYESSSLPPEVKGISAYMPTNTPLISALKDLSTMRISAMDSGSITMQILSHSPLDADPPLCTKINNELHSAISNHPTRLAGFALLPMSDPSAAATELERCVTDLKFLGALVDNHLDGTFYDDSKFWPVFAKAEELDVPIYIHPTFAAESMMPHYRGNYSEQIAGALSAFGWGWHTDTGLHFLRLYSAGLFDRFPKLKIVLGHMGELLPYQFERTAGMDGKLWKLERGLRTVWDENLWITTSGMFSLPPLECLLKVKGKGKVMFSVDYPFSATEKGRGFIEEIEKSGLLSTEELKDFGYRNAARLLKIKL